MRTLIRRAGGLGLMLLALAPLLIVGGALVLITKVSLDTVRSLQAGAATLVRTVDEELTPRLRALEAGFSTAAAEAARVRSQVTGSLSALGNIPDLTIQRGQFGATQPIPLRVPDRDVRFGVVSIDNGRLLNQTVPGIPIPVQTVSIPAQPLRSALVQAGQGVDRALQASERQLASTFAAFQGLATPLRAVGDAANGLLAPVRERAGMLASLFWLVLATVVAFTALYLLLGIVLAFRRRQAAATAFQTGGPLGYLGFVFGYLVTEGLGRLLGRPAVASAAPGCLEAQVKALRQELASLRAELAAPPRLRAAS